MNESSPPTHRYQRRVQFGDTDMAGIAHFAIFFRYMEEAEHDFLRSVGLSVVEDLDGVRYSWPRVSCKCDYASPARFEEVVDVDVSIVRLGSKSITYRFLMSIDGRAVARGEIVAVCCKFFPDHRVEGVAIPPHMRAKLSKIAPEAQA